MHTFFLASILFSYQHPALQINTLFVGCCDEVVVRSEGAAKLFYAAKIGNYEKLKNQKKYNEVEGSGILEYLVHSGGAIEWGVSYLLVYSGYYYRCGTRSVIL